MKLLIAGAIITLDEFITSGWIELSEQDKENLQSLQVAEVIRIGLFDIKRIE